MNDRQRTLWIGAVALLSLAGCRAPRSVHERRAPGQGPRILCVVAHPDDEIAFGGTVYKTATFLDGTCDVVVVTNGEGGFKYSTLAESVYGLELTDERVGRAQLPAIRRREMLAGCELLNFRAVHFLEQTDHRYTQDVLEILGDDAHVWNVGFVLGALREIMLAGSYDFVLVLAPTEETHAHHKAASILALRAAAELPEQDRPALLCVRSASLGQAPPELAPLDGFPITRVRAGSRYSFDRRQTFGYRERLDYRIVVNWAIAEHRSQGTMQLLMNEGDQEHYFLFETSPAGADRKARAFFRALEAPQFPLLDYPEARAAR